MFAAAAVCGALGSLAKWKSDALATGTRDLDECVELQVGKNKSSTKDKQYIYFHGALTSDANGEVKDPDTGSKYDVVIMQKKVFDLHDITTITELNGSVSESTKRKESIVLDSGKKFFGSKISLVGDAVSKKTNLKAPRSTTTEVILESTEMQDKVPLSLLFSSLTRRSSNNVNVNINMPGESGLNKQHKRGLHHNRNFNNRVSSSNTNSNRNGAIPVSTESKELVGTRMDVSGAMTGATFTAIGEAAMDSQGKWKIVPCAKHNAVTALSFDEYKGSLRRDSQMAAYASTGLFSIGAAVLVAAMI